MVTKWTDKWQENLQSWLACPFVPAELRDSASFPGNEKNIVDLREIKSETNWPKELRDYLSDAFAAELSFGTAGLRGKMGVGLNRMNVYTVAVASQGVAAWLRSKYSADRCSEAGVVIGYDTRHNSQLFAEVAATVFAANGVAVALFPTYCQTPMLAYAIRPLQALAGIMVTASHNPAVYNGYKLYGSDGIQVGQEEVDQITKFISTEYTAVDFEEALQEQQISYVHQTIERDYIEKTIHQLTPPVGAGGIKIAYTAMHGTGAKIVLPLLRAGGFTNVVTVKEQIEPDGDFPTAPAPNPEFPKATVLLRELAAKEKADLALATDPDADRLAVVIPDNAGEYHQLTGNQTAAFLADYWLSFLKNNHKLPANAAIVKSIVTADLGRSIAAAFGVHLEESLTGFKDICGKIREFQANSTYEYVMGYEESIGYALGRNVLDKDGCSAAYIFAHAAASYKAQGLSLWDAWEGICRKYGYLGETTLNIVREGQIGKKFMAYVMDHFRLEAPLTLAGSKLDYFEDFLSSYRGKITYDGITRSIIKTGVINLRSSNVMRYHFADGNWYALRPSGTEPKLKVYLYASAYSQAAADAKVKVMTDEVQAVIDALEAKFKAE